PVPAGAPTPSAAWTARVLLPVAARATPAPRARVVHRVSPYGPYDQDPQSLLVLDGRRTAHGVWYRVLLPARPNGSGGWVPASAVHVTRTAYRVRVDLGARRLELLRAGRRMRAWPVAVGTPANPTPTGLFALSEIVPQTPRTGFFGPYILTLTAHSTRLSDFDGGRGQVALHGTSLPGLLGRAVSHGCIRMRNDAVSVIARTVPRGAPVEVVR
ncbi:MAG TPA: L,D-transpeptidase, partial [Miltoncostaeaceae bacterium]|nr:L,D-transpeptidase [Miltoncostaeaceae bacterium]